MATSTKSNRGSDRARVSSQKHEISYAGSKLGKGGATKVRKAKQSMGRKTSRKAEPEAPPDFSVRERLP